MVYFRDGFETNDFTLWTSTTGSPTVQNTTKRLGTYAMQTAAASANSKANKDLGAAYSTINAEFDIYFPSLLGLDVFFSCLSTLDAAYGNEVSVAVSSAGDGVNARWALVSPTAGTVYGDWGAIHESTWYHVKIQRTTGAGTGIARLTVDDVKLIERTAETIPDAQMVWGVGVANANTNVQVIIDNVEVNGALYYPYIQQTSDVDSAADVGTHSDFTKQQTAADSTYDTLSEANVGGPGGTATAGNSTDSGTSYTTISQNGCAALRITTPANSVSLASCTFYGRTSSGTFNVKLGIFTTAGVLLANGVSGAVSCSTSAGSRTATWATPPTVSASTNYYIAVISSTSSFRLYYSASTGGVNCTDSTEDYTTPTDITPSTGTINYRAFVATFNRTPQDWQLLLEEQFVSVPYYIASGFTLHVATGTLAAETLNVEVWNAAGSAWVSLGALSGSADNSFDVSSYATSANLYIRFHDAVTGDTTQNTWQIDSVWLAAKYTKTYSFGSEPQANPTHTLTYTFGTSPQKTGITAAYSMGTNPQKLGITQTCTFATQPLKSFTASTCTFATSPQKLGILQTCTFGSSPQAVGLTNTCSFGTQPLKAGATQTCTFASHPQATGLLQTCTFATEPYISAATKTCTFATEPIAIGLQQTFTFGTEPKAVSTYSSSYAFSTHPQLKDLLYAFTFGTEAAMPEGTYVPYFFDSSGNKKQIRKLPTKMMYLYMMYTLTDDE